jgi:glutathione S-transferase
MENFTLASGVRRPGQRGASSYAHLDLHLQADPRDPHGRARPHPRPAGADRVRDGDDALSRRLVTIPISHYCEKARWALDRAGLAYVEEAHVQGLHQLAARRAGGGSSVPVLLTPEGVFAGSEWIVRYADGFLAPGQRLFTPEVVEFCRRLDAGLGPDARRLIYKLMLPRPELMLPYNNQGVPAWEAAALTGLYRVARRWASRKLELTNEDDAPLVLAAFDRVAAQLGDKPFLFGERFTAADLTFACLAAAVVLPPEYSVALPQGLPELQPFREHPAGAFALRLFRELRYSSAAA